jgi:hypothetical protein
MVTSLTLAILATKGAGTASSVLERQQPSTKSAPATSAPATPGQAVPAPGAIPPVGALPTKPGEPAPGAPYVELKDEKTGAVRKVPLDLSKMPKVDPDAATAPASPAGAKK